MKWSWKHGMVGCANNMSQLKQMSHADNSAPSTLGKFKMEKASYFNHVGWHTSPANYPPHHHSNYLKPIHPRKFTINSIDISNEDEPQQQTSSDSEKLRLEEKFAVLNTGIYECRSCGYKYDEGVGDSSYPIPPGYQFEKLPEDWRCPTCGAAQSFFESKSVEIAGFAQNQQYGMGEKQIEVDKRILCNQIGVLKKELEFVRKHRKQYRNRRISVPVPAVSLVGYTNADEEWK